MCFAWMLSSSYRAFSVTHFKFVQKVCKFRPKIFFKGVHTFGVLGIERQSQEEFAKGIPNKVYIFSPIRGVKGALPRLF